MLHETQVPWLDHDGGSVAASPRHLAGAVAGSNDGVYINQLVERLGRDADKPILRYLGRDTAADEFLTMIHRYARALFGIGIGRRKLFALLAPNTPDALAIRYGAHLLGAATGSRRRSPPPQGCGTPPPSRCGGRTARSW